MSGHTLGPWVVSHAQHRPLWVVATDERATLICEISGSPSNPEAQAEARLIAAAPDMLDALKEATLRMEALGQDTSQQREAIARAETFHGD